MNINSDQAKVLFDAIIGLTASDHEPTARRARGALFDAEIIDGVDGGIAECSELHSMQIGSVKYTS